MTRVAVLDDWQRIAATSTDWSRLRSRVDELFFFNTAFTSEDDAAEKLAGFDILLTMRERMAFPASLIHRLPNLRMLGITGSRAPSIDIGLLIEKGVTVCWTGVNGDVGETTSELALGLMLAAVRRIPAGDVAMRSGRFQEGTVPGFVLKGRTLGLLGLGRTGSLLARYAGAIGMHVIAWSQNLTEEKAVAGGADLVSKADLFAKADVLSIHLVLSDRTRGIVGAEDLSRMKPGAVLVNTSRGPIVQEPALLAALASGNLIAALDVFDREPLPLDHPLRTSPNTVLTPHLGYVTTGLFEEFYRHSVENALAFLDGKPIRVMQPPAK